MKLTTEERADLACILEEHALETEFHEWRHDHGFEPTNDQIALFTRLQQLAMEACPAQHYTEWDAEV